MTFLRRAAAPLLLVVLALPAAGAGPEIPPSPTTYVTDGARILPTDVREALEAKLAGFEDETSNQVVVWIEPRVPEGTTLEEYANACFGAWKVGQRDKKNGVVFFVFPEERAARIEVGYGLEGALPDALAGRIHNDEVFPRFRAGDFAGGVTAGVDAIIAATKGEYRGTGGRHGRAGRGGGGEGIPWPLLLFLIFFVLPAVFGRRRRSYWWLGGGGFGSGGFGGFGGGWGGGGGFSGGGGLSGGGGASGRW